MAPWPSAPSTLSLHDALPIFGLGVKTIDTSSGADYSAPTVTFASVDPGGAAGTATVAGGQVTGITVTYGGTGYTVGTTRSEEHTSELQSLRHLVCRLLLEKKK